MLDAVVAGLGPAGSTAARALASKGLKVLAIDKERFPRYKPCGGCISTKIERILDFPISDVIEETVIGATFTYKSGRLLDILSDRPVGHNVMRDKFDNFLVNKAKEAGAEALEGVRVKGIAQDSRSVTVFCDNGQSYKARFLVGADGSSGLVGREYFGLKPKEAAVSVTAEVPYDRAERNFKGKLFIDFGGVPFGYGWIFPKKEFLSVGIAGDAVKAGGRIKDYFNSFIESHEALKGLKVEGRVGWTVPVYYEGSGPVVKGRVLLAGDTGHLVDPFLGEGIYYAIRTANAASGAIFEAVSNGSEDLSPYQAWIEQEILPEFRSAGRLSDLVYNHPRLWYSIIEKDPGIMLRFYDVIRGSETTDSFYSWVLSKIRSKPWKVIRSWIESRFIPA